MTISHRIRHTNDEETDFNAAPGDRGFLFWFFDRFFGFDRFSLSSLIFSLEIA